MRDMLIVVDMLNDFCNPEGVLFFEDSLRVIGPIEKKIKMYRAERKPIIFLKDWHDKNDKEFDRFPPHAIEGQWGSDIIEELEPLSHRDEMIVTKTRYSGFFETHLESEIRHYSPDSVEVCGVCTSICVMDTVGGLANRDYEIKVDSNCVADFDPEMHRMALARMKSLYGAEIV